jgi:DMSO/TMAO reductase YedYZ heme-binding membrane subunit
VARPPGATPANPTIRVRAGIIAGPRRECGDSSDSFLITVLLAGRVPVVERTLGQDRLTRWHRWLAPWALVLIAAHGVLITAGYAQGARTGLLHEFGVLISTYAGILATTVAFVLLMVAGFTSARIARRRTRYETWWAVHLYTYLALALSFSHQLAAGASFVGHPLARAYWTGLWITTAGTLLAIPVARAELGRPAARLR